MIRSETLALSLFSLSPSFLAVHQFSCSFSLFSSPFVSTLYLSLISLLINLTDGQGLRQRAKRKGKRNRKTDGRQGKRETARIAIALKFQTVSLFLSTTVLRPVYF